MGDYETLGGLLINLATEIPRPGQVIRYEKFSFTIEKASSQSVQEVRIRW